MHEWRPKLTWQYSNWNPDIFDRVPRRVHARWSMMNKAQTQGIWQRIRRRASPKPSPILCTLLARKDRARASPRPRPLVQILVHLMESQYQPRDRPRVQPRIMVEQKDWTPRRLKSLICFLSHSKARFCRTSDYSDFLHEYKTWYLMLKTNYCPPHKWI